MFHVFLTLLVKLLRLLVQQVYQVVCHVQLDIMQQILVRQVALYVLQTVIQTQLDPLHVTCVLLIHLFQLLCHQYVKSVFLVYIRI